MTTTRSAPQVRPPAADGAALEVRNVTRTFRTRRGGPLRALDGVDLAVRPGELVGLLGLNGAGKTTLLKIIATLLTPTTGSVHVCGHDAVRDPRAAQRRLAVVLGGDRGLYLRLSAHDNLEFFALLTGVRGRELARRSAAALAAVGLTKAADRPVETYSKGMRQRLHLAIGMVTRPDLLLLDEPTVGLDPAEAQNIRTAVAHMRDEGTAILLTSHDLNDIDQLAERVVVLHHGRVLHDLPLPRLLERAETAAVVTLHGRGRPPAAPSHRDPDGQTWVERIEPTASGWTMTLHVRTWTPDSLRELAASWPEGQISEVRVTPSSLQQVFNELADETGAQRLPAVAAGTASGS
ncbi:MULTISPECIES: ABC transporter ATP-binding protein [unclassified Streptomyces]|uniref:ABC transporter ATP-binding protein n=1 Tax=unclassified Streptomyces TaxID=2593676 RepID=UPI003808D6B9